MSGMIAREEGCRAGKPSFDEALHPEKKGRRSARRSPMSPEEVRIHRREKGKGKRKHGGAERQKKVPHGHPSQPRGLEEARSGTKRKKKGGEKRAFLHGMGQRTSRRQGKEKKKVIGR